MKDGQVTVAADAVADPSYTVADPNQKEEPSWTKVAEKKRTAAEEINRALHEAMRYRPVMVKNRFAKLDSESFAAVGASDIILRGSGTQSDEVRELPKASILSSRRSSRTAARSQRTRFAEMECNDEFGEPIGKPCRSSCGCGGACGVAEVVNETLIIGKARDDSCVEPCNQTLRSAESAAKDCNIDAISLVFLATVDVSPELLLKVKNIKARCEKERKEAEANRVAGSATQTLLAEMMGAVNYGAKEEAWKKRSE